VIRRTVVALLVLSSAALAQSPRLAPIGWGLTGANPESYTAALDPQGGFAGTASAVLASKDPSSPGFGALAQCIKPDDVAGKRVRYTAQVRTRSVSEWAGLWFRVDGSDGQMLAFDNMQGPDRRIHGDTQWQRYSIVADIARDAHEICFGALLTGGGRVWVDAIAMEIVEAGVPLTAKPMANTLGKTLPSYVLLPRPRNLDFEE